MRDAHAAEPAGGLAPDLELAAIHQLFAAESQENLAAMEDALLRLETRPGDGELLGTVFRVAHTLKGDAGNLGLAPVAELAHGVEDLLDRIRGHEGPAAPESVELLLRATDALRALVPAAIEGRAGLHPAEQALLREIAAAAEAEDGALPAPPSPEAVAEGGAAPASPAAPQRARTLRVEVGRLDRAMDLAGEIAIARGRVGQLLEDGAPGREVLEAHRAADALQAELQELVTRLRMVPLGPTFRLHARTVRDVAFANGKLAALEVEGDDVEVDTGVVELLRDALTHLVRNAVDHGIESPADRVRAGKPPQGTVRLAARHEGGSVVVTMRDDGAGLSRERIGQRARERGLAADPDALPDAELFRLVLEPGFSTARGVTELSGRGVGLDVVRRNVESLRGSVDLAPGEGGGTAVTLRLPLTLALIEGFSVAVDGEVFVLPLDAVVECLEMPATRHEADGTGVLALRGAPLPFVRLRDVLGRGGPPPPRENVVVVRHGERRAGVVVDGLVGAGQVVVKPLGSLFRALPGLAGSTILGDGRVALILDTAALIGRAAAAGKGGGPP
jgi:two-component system chemotaxis sensor kinase CheA